MRVCTRVCTVRDLQDWRALCESRSGSNVLPWTGSAPIDARSGVGSAPLPPIYSLGWTVPSTDSTVPPPAPLLPVYGTAQSELGEGSVATKKHAADNMQVDPAMPSVHSAHSTESRSEFDGGVGPHNLPPNPKSLQSESQEPPRIGPSTPRDPPTPAGVPPSAKLTAVEIAWDGDVNPLETLAVSKDNQLRKNKSCTREPYGP